MSRTPRVTLDDLPVGVVAADGNGSWLTVSRETEVMLGTPAVELLADRWLRRVHPGDREEVEASWRPSAGHRTSSTTFRYECSDGLTRHVTMRTRLFTRSDDRAGLVGTISQARAGTRSQAFIDAMLNGSTDLVAVVNMEAKITFASPAATRVLGRDPEFWIGRDAFDLIHPDDQAFAAESILLTEQGGQGTKDPLLLRLAHADGSWRDVEIVANNMSDHPDVEGILLSCRDLTERRRAESDASDSQRNFERIFAQAPIGMALMSMDGCFTRVNSKLCEMVGASPQELTGTSIFERLFAEDREAAIQHATEVISGQHLRPMDVRYDAAGGETKWAEVSVSMSAETQQVVAQIKDVTDHHLFAEMLEVEAGRTAREMDLAARVQRSLLPDLDHGWSGFDVGGDCVPAASVGGDYFDVLETPSGSGLYLVVGDVAGHSLASSMMTTVTRSAMRRAIEAGVSPSLALSGAAETAAPDLEAADSFVTMQCVLLDRERMTASVASGGHNALAVVRVNGGVELHDVDGMPFGFPAAIPYEESLIDLEAGDLVVLYTDGITEARDPEGEMYGDMRFARLLGSLAGSKPTDLVDSVLEALEAYTGTTEWDDDVTVLAASMPAL